MTTTEFLGDIEASISDALALIGIGVSVSDINDALEQAATVIETVSGVVFDAAYREVPISKTNALWVRRAVVFQAAWMIEQHGSLSRQAVSSVSQDGVSVSAQDGLTFVLAPLAKRALSNCNWARSHTQSIGILGKSSGVENILVDDNHAWTKLGAS